MTLHNLPRIVLAVDLDYFFAQCEQVRRPEIKDKPVVICVYSGRSEDSGAVSTSNYVARKLGAKSGMPIVLAKRILAKHPDSVFLRVDKDYYDSVSERIMEILQDKSAKMEQVSIDEAFLDVTEKTNGDYSLALEIGQRIKDEIAGVEHLTCSVGIGPNKLVAKMAADSNKPDGLTVVLPKNVKSFLDPMPVGKLFGVGPKTEEKLNALEIQTIGDLARFDEAVLAREFGRNLGPGLRKSAAGEDDEPVRERELEQISRIVTLKHNAIIFDFTQEIDSLCEDLAKKLQSRKLLCKSVGIIAITPQLKARSHSKTLDAPTDSEQLIRKDVHDLFHSFFEENPRVEVRRAGIKLAGLTNLAMKVDSTLTDYFPN